ncbi:MAG: glucuronate isomerase, partial [Trueperaceae bacterium]
MTQVNERRSPLDPDRCFAAESNQRAVARRLYQEVQALPLICPHGHVPPRLLADDDATFGSPADLFVIPDHYVFRMLHSQGVALEDLGIAPKDGGSYERDHRAIWQRFAEHFHLFRGTPTGLWIRDELASVFGVDERLTAESAHRIYDQVEAKLATPEFRPRALFERFGIEALATTDTATDTLEHHQRLRELGWRNVLPTFRPDAVTDLGNEHWRANVTLLGERAAVEVHDYASFVAALERRREAFRALGTTATDHGVFSPNTERLT